jgi:hypothetical protein
MIRKAIDHYLPTNQSMAGPSIAREGYSLRGLKLAETEILLPCSQKPVIGVILKDI